MGECDCLDYCGDDPRCGRQSVECVQYGGVYAPPITDQQALAVKDHALALMLSQLDGTATVGLPTVMLIERLRHALEFKPGRRKSNG